LRDSESFHRASGTRMMPIGTFSQKMYCHDQPVVTAPPTKGPMATAKAADGSPCPECGGPAFRPHGLAQEGQRERHDHGPARALDGARGDEDADARRERRQRPKPW
jgi:hypothetical protein